MNKSICFAYYGDGKFLGWYSDSFGSITKSSPKIYHDLQQMKPIIQNNFSYKINKELGEKNAIAELVFNLNPIGGALIQAGIDVDKKKLIDYKEIELRVVECPFYDGPNPNFDEEAYDTECEIRKQQLIPFLKENGIDYYNSGWSKERTRLVNEFDENNPRPKCNNWIYADYTKVKQWAENEPTEFIDVIKP